jgi:transmembrane sensor
MSEHTDGFDHETPRVAAVDWWVRKKAGALSQEEKAAFETWLSSDPANAAAFEDISGMCDYVESLAPQRLAKRPMRASKRLLWVGAAALAVASLALFISFDEISLAMRSDIYAGVGDAKTVTLEDGSRVQIDAKSAIALHYTAGERRLALLQGEAWFEVAPDKARPFVVEAAGGTATALGTAFDVALVDKGEARVTVTEHRVEVSSGGGKVIVEEGAQSAFALNQVVRPPELVDVKRATAWRRGKLIFENRPLNEVLAALGRYHHGYLYCLEAATCARRVTGVFDAGDPLQALREIEAFLGLRAIYVTNYLIFLHG